MIKRVIAATLLSLLCACTTTIPIESFDSDDAFIASAPATGKAGVVIYRSDGYKLLSATLTLKNLDNNKKTSFDLVPFSIQRIDLEPGHYWLQGDLGGPNDIAEEYKFSASTESIGFIEFSAKPSFVPFSSGNSYLKQSDGADLMKDLSSPQQNYAVLKGKKTF